MRDPLGALLDFGNTAGGAVVRLNLGMFRPYLVTDPSHVQRVLKDNAATYIRDGRGMLWRPVRRLFGEGVLSEGPVWQASRRALQPLFTARRVDTLVDVMAHEIGTAVDALPTGRPIDIGAELSRVVCRTILRILFAGKVSLDDALRIVAAQNTIATTMLARLLVPFVPNAVPMPGDRAFRAAVRQIDDILMPVVRRARAEPDGGDDVISTLSRAAAADGGPLDERQVRNDTVAMFATATEATFGALIYLWPLLAEHPTVTERLYAEIDEVVGDGPVTGAHLARLTYTRTVLDELLRVYPVAWIFPRVAARADVIDGVAIPQGATILMSPYITHHLDAVWPRPRQFDPDRFTVRQAGLRNRYAYFPFGGGPHQCLGQHLFHLEAQLIVATVLRRFRFRPRVAGVPVTRVAATLRPRDPVEVTLLPRDRVPAR